MTTKRINIALQGGGAHGAFTWGVLDRLLQEPKLEISAISGASAGALNGAALKAGLAMGGPDLARENLDWLWGQVGALDETLMPGWFRPDSGMVSRLIEMSPAYMWADAVGRMISPYGTGPLYENPLRQIADRFRYDQVCSDRGPAFFVCATNVRTGKIRVFTAEEMSTDVILASACLPTLFRAVEIDDPQTGTREAYWDGGYSGNPALFPMFEPDLPDDVVVVNINPLYRHEVPRTPQEIQNRINEISFNSSLLRELRAIQFVRDLIRDGKVQPGTKKDVLVHFIADDTLMNMLSVATKLVPTPSVLADLKEAGQRAADTFLENHWDKIGMQSSVDLHEMFG